MIFISLTMMSNPTFYRASKNIATTLAEPFSMNILDLMAGGLAPIQAILFYSHSSVLVSIQSAMAMMTLENFVINTYKKLVAQMTILEKEFGSFCHRSINYTLIAFIAPLLYCCLYYIFRKCKSQQGGITMFYQRLLELCKSSETNISTVISELNLSSGNLSKWKAGGMPKADTFAKLADYFHVSTDYLLGRTDDPRPVGEEEPTPVAGDGPDPELWKLIQQIPESRMPEVERYLRFQAESKEKP